MSEEKTTLENALDDYDSRHESKKDYNHDRAYNKEGYEKRMKQMDNSSFSDEKCCGGDGCENVTYSEPQADDFVRLGNIEVLLFIQEKSRLKNEKEIDLHILRNTYKDKSNEIKAKYLESEDIKQLGTGKERESVATKRMNEDETIISLNTSIKTLENSVRNISDEVNLAREIYKLKKL